MAKFYGIVGFAVDSDGDFEPAPVVKRGVYVDRYREEYYYGDLMRDSRSLQSSNKYNDDITISNQISILADPFAYQNFHSIRYVKYLGTAWKVTGVEVQYPRLILTVGGVYNVEE